MGRRRTVFAIAGIAALTQKLTEQTGSGVDGWLDVRESFGLGAPLEAKPRLVGAGGVQAKQLGGPAPGCPCLPASRLVNPFAAL